MLRCSILGSRARRGNRSMDSESQRRQPPRIGGRMARIAVAALALIAVAACAKPPASDSLDPQADPIAREFYDDVRGGADLTAEPHLARELKNPTTASQLEVYRALMPAEPPQSVELQNWDVSTDSTGTTTKLTDAYHYMDRTLIARTALFKSPGGQDPVIVGFDLTSKPNS
jgi:hypothetical protein